MMKYLKKLTALLLTLVMLLGIPITANAIQDWYGVSDPLQYTSDLHIGSYTYRAGTSSTVMRLDETNRIAYCIQPDVQIGGNDSGLERSINPAKTSYQSAVALWLPEPKPAREQAGAVFRHP